MAQTGLKYLIGAPITEEVYGQLPTYGEGRVIGRAITVDISLTYGDNPLYADNREVNNDTDLTDGSFTLTVDEYGNGKTAKEVFEVEKMLVGGAITGTEEGSTLELHSGQAVNSTPVGIGYVKTGQAPDTYTPYYEATWYYKMRFKPQGESANTKGGTTTWTTPSLVGDILTIDGVEPDRNLRKKARFAREAEAVEWLNAIANITSTTATATTTGGEEDI